VPCVDSRSIFSSANQVPDGNPNAFFDLDSHLVYLNWERTDTQPPGLEKTETGLLVHLHPIRSSSKEADMG